MNEGTAAHGAVMGPRGLLARTRKRLAVAGTASVVVLLVTSAAAHALSFRRLTAYASAANIHYRVSYCEASPSSLHFAFAFYALDRSSGYFTDDSYDHVAGGCYVARGSFPNQYLGGLWNLRVTISDSHGSLRRRSVHVFVPG
jgi:hypothetical protein